MLPAALDTDTSSSSDAARSSPTRPTSLTQPGTRRSAYARFVHWVRKTHGWVGLWGAVLGLLFGLSGIWLNHRAVLKLPPVAQQRVISQLALPEPLPEDTDAMAEWLQDALDLPAPPNTIRVEPAKALPWQAPGPGATPLRQPERWQFNFGGPRELIQVEYWRGNQSVSVNTTHNGVLATLSNLHKGVGMSVGWILLVDTLAGSLIFLSVSGLILWVQFNRRRALGLGIFSVSAALTGWLIATRL